MIVSRPFFYIIALLFFSLSAQAQGTKEGSVTVKVNESATISLGTTYSRVLQNNATGINYRWYCSSTSIASVSYSSYKGCTVRGKAEGTCKVYFSASFYIDGYYRTYDFYWDVTVSGYTSGGGSGTTTYINPTGVTLYPTQLSLEVGQTYDMSFDVQPSNADYTYDWANYSTSLVSLTQQGRVTALSPGEARIGVRIYKKPNGSQYGDYVQYCIITVTPATCTLSEDATEAPQAVSTAIATVYRTLKANEWNTLCLPFAMSESQVKAAFGNDVQVADFSSWSAEKDAQDNVVGITLGFTDVNELAANHPYIIKPSSDFTLFSVDGVTVSAAETPTVEVAGEDGNAYFQGVYISNADVPVNGLFISGNKFYYSTGATKMKAFRGYFMLPVVLSSVSGGNTGARIRLEYSNETTGISTVDDQDYSDNNCYDLMGRRIASPKRGLYVVNGKKTIVK